MRVKRKLPALLLAVLMCLCGAGSALAEENTLGESASESAVLQEESPWYGPSEAPCQSVPGETPSPEETAPPEESTSPVESSFEEIPSPEPSLSPEPSPSPSAEPGELEGAGLEDGAASFAAKSLLVTGGHKTYLKGYPGKVFRPDNAMTRAEVASMLYGLLAAKPAVSTSKFSDVSMADWYGEAVNSLAKAGVLSGYQDGSFLPNQTITRAEFVCAVTRCFTLDAGTAHFDDVPETHWAYKEIAAAFSAGWVSGVGADLFEPGRSIKRCEAVVVMNVALGRLDSGFAAEKDTQKFVDVPKDFWAYNHITEAAEPTAAPTPTPTPTPTSTPTPTPGVNGEYQVGQTVRVTATSGLNLRQGKGTGYAVVTALPYGTILTLTDVSDPLWLGVKTSGGQTGYVSSEYVTSYNPALPSGAKLSASSLTLRQYQSARLDASVSQGVDAMGWTSSDPSVAVVGYSVPYGGSHLGGIVYGKKPGSTVLTFTDAGGNTKASCTVTVTAPEAVRFAYAGNNTPVVGESFDLTAITDSAKGGVTFTIQNGPAPGSWSTVSFAEESCRSSHGLPVNSVRVFKRNVSFGVAGLYTVRATADGYSGYKDFTVLVKSSGESAGAASNAARQTSNEGLTIISKFEGSVREIEDDAIASGNPTVGYGYVVPVNRTFYNTLTDSELWAMLVRETNQNYGAAVERFRSGNNVKMSQAQFDSLVSLAYNCGTDIVNPRNWSLPKTILNAVVPPQGLSASNKIAGTLNVGNTAMYKEPDALSEVLGTVPGGKQVSVAGLKIFREDRQQVWYQVEYGGKTGWMPAGYVQLSGYTRDLAYADATSIANNFLQWCHSGKTVIPGLLYRRLAEAKMFLFANYQDAYRSSPDFKINTYGFLYPSDCAAYDFRN